MRSWIVAIGGLPALGAGSGAGFPARVIAIVP
jgi:hypothetical protein